MVQLLCGWKAHVVILNVSICVYKFNAAFLCKGEKTLIISVTGHSLIQVSPCLERKAAPKGGDHRCSFRRKLVEITQVLVANGSLPCVVTRRLGSSKFGFQVDSKLAVVPDKVQGQHKVHLRGTFSLPTVMTQLCAPSPQ